MKIKHKLLIVAAVLVIVVPLAILLGINLYIQSPKFQTTLEKSLAERWGIRLDLREATFTPWGGLNALGVCEATKAKTGRGTRLHADLKILPLLERQIVLNDVELYQPYAEWLLSETDPSAESEPGAADQAWRAVQEPRQHQQQQQVLGASALRMANVSPSPAPANAPGTADRPAETEQDFYVTILDLKVIDGQLVIRENLQPPLLKLDGMNLEMTSMAPGEFRGKISVERAQVLDSLVLTQLTSPLDYRENELDFAQIAASMAGGEVHGALNLTELDARPHFDLHLDYYEVELARLIRRWEKPLSFEKGTVEGGVRLSGRLDNLEMAVGAGEVIIAEARMGSDTFLSSIGQVFGIEELRNLYARQIVLSARISDGIIHLQRARLESDSIVCNATGDIKSAGQMDFQVQLMLHEDLHKRIPPSFLQGFRPMEDDAFSCLDFVVLGDLDSPRTDLLDRLFPNKDLPVGNLLKLLFPQQNWYVSGNGDGNNS